MHMSNEIKKNYFTYSNMGKYETSKAIQFPCKVHRKEYCHDFADLSRQGAGETQNRQKDT